MLKKLMTIFLTVLLVVSCGSNRPRKDMSAEERLEYAIKKFEDEDYFDAKTEFKIIVLNFPGHNIVDKAQYYLAQCHFEQKEYILAMAEFEKLTRMFPNSKFIDDALFKVGLSNFKLSPKYSLDQTYTLKAIEELQRFIEEYPQSEFIPQATDIMSQCRNKLAKKEFKNGELYRKMSYYRSAILYFESVLNNYYDTEWAEKSQYWLAYCLQKNDQYIRAKQEYKKYLEKHPDSKKAISIKNSIQKIDELIKEQQAAEDN